MRPGTEWVKALSLSTTDEYCGRDCEQCQSPAGSQLLPDHDAGQFNGCVGENPHSCRHHVVVVGWVDRGWFDGHRMRMAGWMSVLSTAFGAGPVLCRTGSVQDLRPALAPRIAVTSSISRRPHPRRRSHRRDHPMTTEFTTEDG